MKMEGTLTILPRGGVEDDGSPDAAYRAAKAAEAYGLHGEALCWAIECRERAAKLGLPQP